MKVIKTISLSLMLSAIPQLLMAQDTFGEMIYSKVKTLFKLNAPTTVNLDGMTGATTQIDKKKQVEIHIYEDGQGGKAIKTIKMKASGENRWEATVKGDLKGKFYTFDIGKGETPGVFAKAVGVNGMRGAIVDMAETNPQGWENDQRPVIQSPADLVIYEMHWRDFSIDVSSGLKNKGKFLALTEPKAIEHLKSLGVNAVHILPSFDYASVDETKLDTPQYNWGYDPKNYNVPEGSYSTDPYNPVTRIKEFKQMVQALHKAGIRVILDVVYNHTFNIDHSNFQLTYPDMYYRKTADGKYSDGSGCGNETASEKPLMREFMLESVKYWIDEYHIDGFRFDLMGVHDIETMQQIRAEVNKIDPSIYIYGEGWSAGSCAYPVDKLAMKANAQQLNGIAAFSDDMRDALRGPFSDDHKGALLAGIPGEEESLKFGIVGGIAHPQVDMTKVNYDKKPWTNNPTEQISYVSCHDDMCLVDRLKASIPSLTDKNIPEKERTAELIRIDQLAQTAVFTSQGVPFILSGEEMLRDKKGVHNSYNSPDSINHLDWNNLQRYPQLFAYYKNLIQLRKNHPAFRLATGDKVRQHLEFLPAVNSKYVKQDCLVGFLLKDLQEIDAWKTIVVIYNFNKEAKEMAIPEGNYTIACCNGTIDEAGLGEVSGKEVLVDGQSALILFQK
ncbi:pullulanase type I [Prevotella sp. CAG:732]|nr:type I pullulanase [Prevotella sp. CAG:732]CDD20918.1 pullulanase type I [Prevotella sp. CAG:732]